MLETVRLGANLKARRIILGLPQELVAERANISRATLMRLEAGEGGKVEHLMTVASVLGIAEDIIQATDPLNSDLGRARAHLLNRQRAPRRT
ncbi:transcriptional regulator with XRE-family HTH domain [Arthrobacter silviterrae]|uniref:Helix-turn-helix transcriptional regulator n=1 Tax=Arthrobacter silviterrae TaxID=2026658 RepID=A0ABX0D9U3_9MICC|nr:MULTISPECIES: helix-turn-helix transcriptional regulator [Arthrobacter]MCU6481668.1 helix-turn-helix domain-containing protein [Arthrobacter sp. A2-55]MDQ0279215.1 transcriptional regulator with XRE-family HTH domain [Arthrobacter silviterrae]NGN83666.1 helix-turn-helix transcriptional regulator [Arthrobacter silviterrae]